MPTFDLVKAKEQIRAAKMHRNHPGGELMVAIAEQLEGAVDEITTANNNARSSQVATLQAERALADERSASKDVKEQSARIQGVVEGMRQIAAGAKGPKKLAHDILLAHGYTDDPAEAGQKPEVAP